MCQAGGDPNCDTLSGCSATGEAHRVGWEHTDCSDASHHICIHVSVGGGSYAETADNISCDNADPDAGCCDWTGYAPEGEYLFHKSKSSDLGSCTTTYQYRVRIETDGTDVLLGSACTDATSITGCDTDCIA